MKLQTLSFQEILKLTEDVYEAAMVVSRRSRQIIDRRVIEQAFDEEEFLEEIIGVEENTINEDYEELDKIAPIAMNEFLTGELEWHYAEKTADDETAEDA